MIDFVLCIFYHKKKKGGGELNPVPESGYLWGKPGGCDWEEFTEGFIRLYFVSFYSLSWVVGSWVFVTLLCMTFCVLEVFHNFFKKAIVTNTEENGLQES